MQIKLNLQDLQDWQTMPKDGREFLVFTNYGFMIFGFNELENCFMEITFEEAKFIDISVRILGWIDLTVSPEA